MLLITKQFIFFWISIFYFCNLKTNLFIWENWVKIRMQSLQIYNFMFPEILLNAMKKLKWMYVSEEEEKEESLGYKLFSLFSLYNFFLALFFTIWMKNILLTNNSFKRTAVIAFINYIKIEPKNKLDLFYVTRPNKKWKNWYLVELQCFLESGTSIELFCW